MCAAASTSNDWERRRGISRRPWPATQCDGDGDYILLSVTARAQPISWRSRPDTPTFSRNWRKIIYISYMSRADLYSRVSSWRRITIIIAHRFGTSLWRTVSFSVFVYCVYYCDDEDNVDEYYRVIILFMYSRYFGRSIYLCVFEYL